MSGGGVRMCLDSWVSYLLDIPVLPLLGPAHCGFLLIYQKCFFSF